MTEDEKKLLKYTLYGFANGVMAGLVGAVAWNLQARELPDSLLAEIKSLFLKEGPIAGAWIESRPRTTVWHNQRHQVYFGGITREEQDGLAQYQFMFDARTRELLDLKKEAGQLD
ncbi:peptidase [Lapidilactobacillus wuchangensis]|uniref:peptidase n=1 Tax=Lapidilactobacillus wuchangensis TaxID=2486001 RepID=UPI000F7A4B41|nr:peptidase [Lapidilactobacillus wuchangensis]